jgi:hypothetical protein
MGRWHYWSADAVGGLSFEGEERVMRTAVAVLVVALALVLVGNVATGATIYENGFESPGDLVGWQIAAASYGIVPGVTPCNIGQNVLRMYDENGGSTAAYYTGGVDWTNYCFSVWGETSCGNWTLWVDMNVFFRVQSVGPSNCYKVQMCMLCNGNIELQRVVDGVGYPIATVPYCFGEGEWYNIRVEVGSLLDPYAIKVYVNYACDSNYQLVISTRDTTYSSGSIAMAATPVGGAYPSHSASFDHVKVATLDDGGASGTEAASWGRIKALYSR